MKQAAPLASCGCAAASLSGPMMEGSCLAATHGWRESAALYPSCASARTFEYRCVQRR